MSVEVIITEGMVQVGIREWPIQPRLFTTVTVRLHEPKRFADGVCWPRGDVEQRRWPLRRIARYLWRSFRVDGPRGLRLSLDRTPMISSLFTVVDETHDGWYRGRIFCQSDLAIEFERKPVTALTPARGSAY